MDGELTWMHADHLHSATIITDAAGAEIRRLAYRAFGEEAENIGSGETPKYSYTGKERDSSGLMYYGARYYDPALSRFIRADTIYDGVSPQGLNRYSYVLNNPILYIDPSGHAHWYHPFTNAVANAHANVNNQLAQLDEASGYNPFVVAINNGIIKTAYDVGFGIVESGAGLISVGEQTGEWLADPADPNKVPIIGLAGKELGESVGKAIVEPSVETVSRAVAATANTVGIAAGGVQTSRMLGVPGTKGNPKVSTEPPTSNPALGTGQSPSVEVDKFGNIISREPKSIHDQMTLDAAKQGEGIVKIDNLGDPRYSGMQKIELETISAGGKKSNVHYVRNPETGQQMDYKFTKHSTDYIHNYEKAR